MKHELIEVEFPREIGGLGVGEAGKVFLNVCRDNEVPQFVALTLVAIFELAGADPMREINQLEFNEKINSLVQTFKDQGIDITSNIIEGMSEA